MLQRLAPVLVIGLLATACQAGDDAATGGLLSIVDDTGNVVVLTPEGEVVSTVTDLDGSEVAFQPVWSGADHLAFVEQGAVGGTLVVTDIQGSPQRTVEFVTAPFYVYPEPGGGGSADIVTLRNHLEGGLAAEVVHDDGSFTVLDGGFPFFFTWTGDRTVVAHSGGSRLDLVYPDRRATAVVPGSFGAPSAYQNSVVYIRLAGSTTYLSVLTGEQSRDLATVTGPTQLVVGGDRVAVRSVASDQTPSGIEAGVQTIPSVRAGTLAVLGLDNGSVEIVADEGIMAFFWDRSGRRLLYLEIVDADAAEVAWHVWEDGEALDFPTFIPDPSWVATFTPFFDQYAQSMSLWSPDGTAFAYPGRVGDETGVWIQHLDLDSPDRLSSGSWVAWGPGG